MAKWTVFVLGVLACCWQVGGDEQINYDNHTLVRLTPKTERQLESVKLYEAADQDVQILKVSRGLNDSFDILVPPHRRGYVEAFANIVGLDHEVKKENYGRQFQSVERSGRRSFRRGANRIFSYNSDASIQEYLNNIAQRYPDLVQLQTLGRSSEGRTMRLVKISKNPDANNPIIFVDAGIHAREWVAPAMAIYLIHRLTNDPTAEANELNGLDWYILPLVNPDGYEFTRSSRYNRLWRKTRSQTSQSGCIGVDGNRNYGFHWGVSGVSSNPCNKETYAGPEAFSEPETQMVRNVMHEYANRMKLYVSMHSYGNYLVYPWGYTGAFLPKEWKKLDRLARQVSKGVESAGGLPFKVLSAGKWYAAAGGSDDYAFGAVGVPYSYTMELTDGYEFEFPEKGLQKVLPQFYEGFRVFGAQIRQEFCLN